MNSVSASGKLAASITLSFVFLLFAAASPNHAFAQTASIQTQELLPPGQNTCQVISVTDLEPHIYGGVLESFDVTISDTSNSYVGVFAQVGNTAIPLTYITRWAGTPNGLRIHVDTPDTPVGSGKAITLTLLSSPPGAPTCASVVTFDVSGYGTIAPYVAPVVGSTQSNSAPVTAPVQSTAGNPATVSTNAGGNTGTTQTQTVSSNTQSASTSMAGAAVASASNMKFFNSICSGNNSYRLWIILLLIYLIIVAIVVFAEPWYLEDSVLSSTATILIPLILLLAFWYFSEACRAASWIPVVACVIAIVGLFLAFREYEIPPLLPAASDQ